MRVAFGVSWSPAPNSSSVFALSYIATLKPAGRSANAAVSPAIPAPAMIARGDKPQATSRNSHSAGEQGSLSALS
jgi:hypothetical protein